MVRREYKEISFTNARGGKGTYTMQQILLPEEMLGHGRLFARATLPPGASIGWHRHIDEFEAYYILSGEALYTDDDGTKTVLKAGDLSTVDVGKCHMLENLSEDTDVEAIFLIIHGENKTAGRAETEPLK
jgi:mannose-6-phosphate isomerase-like protein (cupin superfamily)